MTQKEKLMALLGNPEIMSYPTNSFTERLADYLLENGVIVPPVKVGDTVYCVEHDFVDRGVVYAVLQDEEALWISARYDSGLRYDYPSHLTGCHFFLTREEAERVLKERGGGDA